MEQRAEASPEAGKGRREAAAVSVGEIAFSHRQEQRGGGWRVEMREPSSLRSLFGWSCT
ncbi:hypothetical protein MUK42_16282 [Musa troglodytarum]|uniref:Uncharacterized protein n=1 Tax=Musa troglodytarum TaxID=320322 RepID=A0A9E7KV22_9LILI|nr:hypothetical protein MUK42_16282 [Musa troglodytarum]